MHIGGIQGRCRQVNKGNKYVLMVWSFVFSLPLQDRLWCPLGSPKVVTGAFFTKQDLVYACILIRVHTCYNLWQLSPVTVWRWWKVPTGANINTKHMQAVCSKRWSLYSWGTHFESWPEYRVLWRSSRVPTVLLGEWESIPMVSFWIHCNILYIVCLKTYVTKFPGYSPSPIKQKSSHQHWSKSE
jgi:hypothetical protein